MKRIVLSVCAAVAAAVVAQGAGDKFSTRDYVQNGLIAIYDGFENSLVNGVRMHKPDATKWDELMGNGESFVNPEGRQILTFLRDRVTLSGCVVTSLVSTLTTELGNRTLEVVFRTTKCTSTDLSAIYVAKTTQGGIYYQCPNTIRLCAEFYESKDKTFHWHQGSSAWDGSTLRTYSLVTDSSTGTLYSNGASQSISFGGAHDVVQTQILSLGTAKAGNDFEYCSIRLYNRKLSSADLAANRAVDVARFNNGQLYDASALQVQGDPLPYGGVSPAYGEYEGLLPGDRRTCSVVSSTGIGRTNVTCIGYAVYTNDVRTAGAEYMSGDGSSFEYVHPADACATIVWKWHAEEDTSLPLVEDVTVRAQGDALVVRGTLSELGGESCALKVYVRETGDETVNEWTSDDWTRTEIGDFKLTLCESDPTSPRAFKFGKTYFVTVEATASGGTSRSEEVVFAGATPRAALYEQNGMIINLDAIENAGPGVHLDDTSAWHDLKGNADMALGGTAGFTDRYVNFDGSGWAFGNSDVARDVLLSKNGTVEVTAMSTAASQNDKTIYALATTDGKNRGLYVRAGSSSNLIYCFDYLKNTYQICELKTPVETMQTLSATLGSTCYFSQNGTRLTTPTASAGGLTSLGTNSVSFARIQYGGKTDLLKCRFYAFRMYDRRLTAEEAAYNYKIDRVRFEGASFEDAFGDEWRMSLDGETLQCRVRVVSPVVGVGTDGVNFSTGTNDFWVTRGETVTILVQPTPGLRVVWADAPADTVCSDTGDQVSFTVMKPLALAVADAFIPTHVWTGAASTDFDSAANWTNATADAAVAAPTGDADVYIPAGCANQPTAATPFSVGSFRIGRLAGESGTATFTASTLGTNVVSGNCSILAGGTMTHTAGSAKLNLNVDGDLTVRAKGRIDVIGKGNSGLGKCASYGGEGPNYGTLGACYGSLRYPHDLGSVGQQQNGSGAIRVFVTGTMRIDGTVTAEGQDITHAGSGGSVWLDAARIVGADTGIISARGTDGSNLTSGGGRIALYLRDPAAKFDDFRGTVTARGGYTGSWSTAAGTIYEQLATQQDGEGTLIIDNNNKNFTTRRTVISSSVRDTEVGEVILRGKAYLKVDAGCELRVHRGVHSDGGGTDEPIAGTIRLVGTEDAHFSGPISFNNISCDVPGKKLFFGTAAEDIFTVVANGSLAFVGAEDNMLSLLPEDGVGSWKMSYGAGVNSTFHYAAVSNCVPPAGSASIVVYGGRDLGGNGAKVTFSDFIRPGARITWTGEADADWGNAANWDPQREVLDTDVVAISASAARYPDLTGIAALTLNSLEVEEGASLTTPGVVVTITNNLSVLGTLTMNGGSLTVEKDMSVAATGALVCSGKETVTCRGNVSFAAASGFAAANSTFVLDGVGGLAANLGGVTFNRLTITSGAGDYAFGNGFSAGVLRIPQLTAARALTFASGSTVTVGELYADGVVSQAAALTLKSSTPGVKWNLVNTRFARAEGVVVSDSDATGGLKVYAYEPSLEGTPGSTTGWVFGQACCKWIGADKGVFSKASNWSTGYVPGPSNTVFIAADAAKSLTAASAIAVSNLVVGGGTARITLTANAAVSVVGDVLLLDAGTLSLTKPMTVGGDMVIGYGGVLTHAGSATEENGDSVNLTAANLTIEKGGKIDVVQKGFSKGYGPGVKNGGAGSYGGKGGEYQGGSGDCYGSVCCPTNWGSGSANTGAGAGRVRLQIPGTLTLDGDIEAGNEGLSKNNSVGSGGSVWITCGRLSGSGDIDADAKCGNLLGGGGRIAVYLTDPDAHFSDCAVTMHANSANTGFKGGCGTIYKKEAMWQYGQVFVGAEGNTGSGVTQLGISQSRGGDVYRDTKNFDLIVGTSGHLSLVGDLTVNDLDLAVTGASLELNQYTLTIRSSAHKDGRGWVSHAVTSNQVDGVWGKIVWKKPGFALIIR